MAERYGEIPPRFTKKWWEYFWYYYKWRVIITALAIVIAAVTVVQCATRTRYDMTVVYAGHKNYSEGEITRFSEILSEYISDIDENGEKNVMFMPLMFVDNNGSEEYDYAMQTKLDMTFTEDYTFIYLMDKSEAQLYLNRQNIANTFENSELFYSGSDAEILRAPDGTGYAVSLADSALLKNNDINCEDLYILIAINGKTGEKNAKSQEDAISIAKELIKGEG